MRRKNNKVGNDCLLITITTKVDALCPFIFVIEIKLNLLPWKLCIYVLNKAQTIQTRSQHLKKADNGMEVFRKLKLFQLILLGCSTLGTLNNPSILWDSNNPM